MSKQFDPKSSEHSKRYKTIVLIVVGSFLLLGLRLWYLQIFQGAYYRIKSENNRMRIYEIPPLRGMIFDRNGELLVDDRPAFDLCIIPEECKDNEDVFNKLENFINIKKDKITNIIKENHFSIFSPIVIKRNIKRRELAVIETHMFNLPGIHIRVRPRRNYIYGSLASHLIGYMGEITERELKSGKFPYCKPGDMIGKYGIEYRWDRFLTGKSGIKQVEVDSLGRQLHVIFTRHSIPGKNIFLTIDRRLQMKAEELIKNKRGAVVALDPKNGEVLALASSPGFDPNEFIRGITPDRWRELNDSRSSPLQNRAISGLYPPGSVFKIVVALAGLQESIIDPEKEIFCSGKYSVGNTSFRCWKKGGHGTVSLHRAIVESCDVYFYKAGRDIGVDKIARWARRFGFGHRTGIDLNYEAEGLVPDSRWKLKRFGMVWHPGETVSMAIGQGYTLVTPIQMACFIASIFNGGLILRPHVVRYVGDLGESPYRDGFIRGYLPVDKDKLELVKSALIGVVNEEGGTGWRARIRGVVVGGKTGTAQVVGLEKGKRIKREDIPYELRDHAWFVAVAPADSPEIAVSVVVEHGGHGGSAAAPIAKEIIKTWLNIKEG